jgi:hypothetical protein
MLDAEHPPGGPDSGSPGGGPPAGATRFLADVQSAFEDRQAARRLSLAGVRAQFDLTDAPLSLTLLLDRYPPELVTGVAAERPTVRISLSSEDLGTMLAEGAHLPMAILAGDVVFEGSVRKLLRVLPILRGAVVPEEFRDGPAAG